MNRTLVYIIFIVAVVGIGVASGFANLPGEWYQALQKPVFNPPNWIFGPVWTTLYLLIGIVGARTWLAGKSSTLMKLWFVQMILNFLWSPAFFGMENPVYGLVVILPLLASIVAFIAMSWNRDRISALLFVPYVLWVGFATLLNLSIVLLN